MQAKTLVRYGAPVAIISGALMIITRPVILFTTPTEIGAFTEFVLGTTHAVNSVVSIVAFALLVIAWWPSTSARRAAPARSELSPSERRWSGRCS